MHMIVGIYKFYYLGLLQNIQAILRWKIIHLNPLHRYQPSQYLCLMILRALEQIRFDHWARQLTRYNTDATRNMTISHLSKMKIGITSKDMYSLVDDLPVRKITNSFVVHYYYVGTISVKQ